MRESEQSQHAERIVGERRAPARPESAGGEIAEPSGRIVDLGRPAEERAELDGQGVDGDVASAEVGVEIRAPEVGEIEVERRRRGQDHPRHPVGLTERDERAPEAIRQSTGHRGAIARQDEVDVVKRPPEQEIADRAAHQPHRAAGELGGRLE